MKIRIGVLCLLVAGCAGMARGEGTELGEVTFRPDMPVNTWVRVEPEYVAPPSGGRHWPSGWNKLVYDPVGKRMIYMDRWRDDVRKNTIYANAVMEFDIVENRVTCLKLTNWKRRDLGGGAYQTVPMPENEDEPTPADRHPYGNMTVVPEQNALYLAGGANQTARPRSAPAETWRFDLEEHVWTKVESDVTPPNLLEDVMEYDPSNRIIVRLARDGRQTWLLDIDEGQWRNAEAENNPRCGKSAAMCYDSKRERILLYGGPGRQGQAWNDPGPEMWAYSVEENAWTRLPDAPVSARAPGMAYDARRDVVMIHARDGRDGPPTVAFYFPEENEWRVLELPEEAEGPSPSWHTLAYDPVNDVFVRTAGGYTDPQWWLFRPDPSKAVAPE